MSGTDITNLLDIVQRKINAVDSSASTSDLLYLLSAIRQSGEGSVFAYDNESQIPNLLDGTPDPEMIAYTLDSDKLYFQRGSWVGKEIPIIPIFQGSNFGYTSGGHPAVNVIDKFPFSADANATDVGDLTVGRYGSAGQSSQTHGYASGGGTTPPAGVLGSNVIDKFSFTSDANATDVGDLTVARYNVVGQSSTTHGYSSGGSSNVIDKFTFSADANATDVGDLTVGRISSAGQSSQTHGYTSGGATTTDVIDKFPFSSDDNATDIGDLSVARYTASGQSSTTHGYSSGGYSAPAAQRLDTIDKFTFSTDANATDVGNLTVARTATASQSSTTHGYTAGGYGPNGPLAAVSNVIDKFPFASDDNATDVGNLTLTRLYVSGQQY
jgi:hypothetical protein